MFAAILHALPYLLGALFVAVAFYGFWQGLSLRPHAPENRVRSRLYWFCFRID